MYEKLHKIREERAEGDRGFTLIELLVVVVIIGILVAIAIPLYLNYRKGAENKSTQSDIRNAIPTIEQAYSDATPNAYPATLPADVHKSSGVTLSYKTSTGAPAGYVVCGFHSDTNVYYVYSTTSGSVAKVADKAAATTAGCTEAYS